jgi:tight adherence protein B
MIAGRRAARARTRELEQLPGVCHALARELRRGRSLHLALRAVVADPTLAAGSLATVVRRAEAGEAVATALGRWAAALDHPDAHLVRAVLAVGDATGAALAPSLDRAAATMRERAELGAEIRALTAQSRASALLLTVSPLAFLALLAGLDRGIVAVVVATPLGWTCLIVGAALDGVGWWWMRRLVAGVEA